MSEKTFVIVGGGLAAAKAAETLRSEGFDGAVVIVTAEDVLPYERPPLSKEVLAGSGDENMIFPHDAAWYADKSIDVRTKTRAAAINRRDRTLELSDGSSLGYDTLLLATGSAPRKLKIDGSNLAGVHYLRTKANADDLKAAIAPGGKKVVSIGAGWIGLEVIAAAQNYGNEVTVVDPQPVPLRAALGDELGGMFAELHREKGVTLRLGTGVSEIVREDGHVTGVRTEGNDVIPADIVVIGIGARPMAYLAEDAGLAVDNGILVDSRLQTSDENIYAAGDVANVDHAFYGRRVRVEHWDNAMAGGEAAAKAMLGQDVSYDNLPYFFTDQYDLGMEFVGDLAGEGFDAVTYRGDKDAREFVVFWTKAGRVVAGMNVNVWDVADDVKALIRARRPVDLAKLADGDVPLADLAG